MGIPSFDQPRSLVLNLQSKHLKRATIDILCPSIELRIASKKLDYLNIGKTNVTNFNYFESNIPVIGRYGILFNRSNSTCTITEECSLSYYIYRFFTEHCCQVVNFFMEPSTTFLYEILLYWLKSAKKLKYLHCSFRQELLIKVLKSFSLAELSVTSKDEDESQNVLCDDLHQILLKLINDGSLVKYHLPWTCSCPSDCPLKTIKPKIG